MKKIIILFVASLLATSIAAQVSPQEQRDFNRKAYEVIKTYSSASQMRDHRDKAQFLDLFEDTETKICNDLMGLNYDPALSVNKYAELLGNADMVTVNIRDVKKDEPIVEKDGKLLMSLSFLKRISLLSPCNTFFDSFDFFGRDYNMTMTLVYDPQTGVCQIRELTSNGVKPEFPSDYRVLVQTDKRDKNLDINGKYINFQLGQKILRPSDRIFYRGARVKEKEMKDQCDRKVFATYRENSWRIRINGGIGVTNFYKLGNSTEVEVNKNNENSLGIDFGYVFPTTSHFRIGIFAGVGISLNNLGISMVPTGNDLIIKNSNQDIDGNIYDRIYECKNGDFSLRQNMKITDLMIPLYADFEYEINSIFSIYSDLGIKLTHHLKNETTIENNEFYVSGIYPTYQDLIIDRYINNFGVHQVNSLQASSNGLTLKNSIDGIIGLGARFNLSKSIALDAGLQYQIGGESIVADQTNSLFSYKLNEGGVVDGETLNIGVDSANLMYKVGSLKHNALRTNISLIFKF